MNLKVLWLAWRDLYASRRILDEARDLDVEVAAVEVTDLCLRADDQQVGIYAGSWEVAERWDALCVRTFHPYVSEMLTVARAFHAAGKVVIDESLTDEGYAISKMHDYLALARTGVPVPRSCQVYDRARAEEYAEELGYPCVVKGVHGSQGLHVHRVNDVHQLRRRLRQYADGELLVQEFLPADEDYRVLVVGYVALPKFVVRHPRPGDFRTNFAAEGEGLPRELTEARELGVIAERAARTLRREFAAVDIRMRQGQPLVLEVNRRPDFEGFEDATGLNVAQSFLTYARSKALGQ